MVGKATVVGSKAMAGSHPPWICVMLTGQSFSLLKNGKHEVKAGSSFVMIDGRTMVGKYLSSQIAVLHGLGWLGIGSKSVPVDSEMLCAPK